MEDKVIVLLVGVEVEAYVVPIDWYNNNIKEHEQILTMSQFVIDRLHTFPKVDAHIIEN